MTIPRKDGIGRSGLTCNNCLAPIVGEAVAVNDGTVFCCEGCREGGPCCCVYDYFPAEAVSVDQELRISSG